MDVHQVVGALRFLEGKHGSSPSVEDVAEQAGCSPATALKYLRRAVNQNLIAQRNGKYMSLAVARAFDNQKQ